MENSWSTEENSSKSPTLRITALEQVDSVHDGALHPFTPPTAPGQYIKGQFLGSVESVRLFWYQVLNCFVYFRSIKKCLLTLDLIYFF